MGTLPSPNFNTVFSNAFTARNGNGYRIVLSGNGTNSNNSDVSVFGTNLLFRLVSDDQNSSTNWLTVGRAGLTPTSVSFSLRPTFNGNTAWDSGNFNPASYAALSGATFTGGGVTSPKITLNSSTPLQILGGGNGTDQNNHDVVVNSVSISFRFVNDAYNAANAWLTVTRSGAVTTATALAVRPTFNGSLAWDAGNFNPANYAALSSAPVFTGDSVTTTGSGGYKIKNTGGGTDRNNSDYYAEPNGLHFRLVNDGYTAALDWMSVSRNGYTPTGIWMAVRPAFGANIAWDAGNFNPANYAALNSSPSFSGAIAALNLYLNGPANTETATYIKQNNTLRFYTGVSNGGDWFVANCDDNGAYKSTALLLNRSTGILNFGTRPFVGPNVVWDAGNFNPSSYAALNSSPVFTGSNTASSYIANGGSYAIKNTGLGTDKNNSDYYSDSTGLHFRFINDAYNAASDWMSITRSGYTPTGIFMAVRPQFAGNFAWDAGNFNPANYAALTGATYTGGVNVTNFFSLNSAANTENDFYYKQNGILRAYHGINSSGDFFFANNDDVGNYRNTPLTISRSSGAAAFSNRPTFNGNTPWDSGNLNPANYLSLSGDAGSTTALASGATNTLPMSQRFGALKSVLDFGVDLTGTNDSTAALTAALNSGSRIYSPPGTIRLLNTVHITTPAHFTGFGPSTFIKYDAPSGSPAAPAINVQKQAVGTILDNFAVDHQANTKGFGVSTIYGGDIIAGATILVQADNTSVTRLTVSNAYDNGIAVIQFNSNDPYNGVKDYTRGSPKYYSIKGIRTFYCGVGSTPKAGAGVDIGAGAFGVVDDLVDMGSYGAFILDTGAGAQGTFSNMIGIGTKVDPSLGYSYTFYIGGSGSTFTNLHSIDSQWAGMWIDGNANAVTVNNYYCKSSKNIGLMLTGPSCSLSNITINSPGYGLQNGTVDAVMIDTTPNTALGISIDNLKIVGEFTQPRYGINFFGSGPIVGSAINSNLGSAITPYNTSLPATFSIVDGIALGASWTAYTPTIGYSSGTASNVSASGKYRKVGRTIDVVIVISQSNVGSASGDIALSLPFPSLTRTTFTGQESQSIGCAVAGTAYAGGGQVAIKKYDGSSLAINNTTISISAVYETNQ